MEAAAPTRACRTPVSIPLPLPSHLVVGAAPQVGLARVHLDSALTAGLLPAPLLQPPVRHGRLRTGAGGAPRWPRVGGSPQKGWALGWPRSRAGFGGASLRCCCRGPDCAAALSRVPTAGLASTSRCPVPCAHCSWRASGAEAPLPGHRPWAGGTAAAEPRALGAMREGLWSECLPDPLLTAQNTGLQISRV